MKNHFKVIFLSLVLKLGREKNQYFSPNFCYHLKVKYSNFSVTTFSEIISVGLGQDQHA